MEQRSRRPRTGQRHPLRIAGEWIRVLLGLPGRLVWVTIEVFGLLFFVVPLFVLVTLLDVVTGEPTTRYERCGLVLGLLAAFFICPLVFGGEWMGPSLFDLIGKGVQPYDLTLPNFIRYSALWWLANVLVLVFPLFAVPALGGAIGLSGIFRTGDGADRRGLTLIPLMFGGFYLSFFVPLLVEDGHALEVIAAILVVCGTAPPVEACLRAVKQPGRALQLRHRLAVFSVVAPALASGFMWVFHALLRASLIQVVREPGPVFDWVNLHIPLRLVIEAWAIASGFSLIVAWQAPVITVWRVAGVAITAITLATVPVGSLISRFHLAILERAMRSFAFVRPLYLRALLYVLVLVGLREAMQKVKARLTKTVLCPNCNTLNSPVASYCSQCGTRLNSKTEPPRVEKPTSGNGA